VEPDKAFLRQTPDAAFNMEPLTNFVFHVTVVGMKVFQFAGEGMAAAAVKLSEGRVIRVPD
jgi:hypothetical protein